MSTRRFAALLPLALFAAASCKDGASTSPAASPRARDARVSAARLTTASVTIPPVGGFTSQALARGGFADDVDVLFRIKEENATQTVHVDDPSDMVMARVSIVPGGALPWHSHPGPALVTIAAGELTLVDGDDCAVRRYAAGTSFMDAGQGHVHAAFNGGGTEMVLYVTYLDVPAGQSPLVPTSNPGC